MASPRKAIVELGMEVLCLLCDASDEPGQKRCSNCIATHRTLRQTLKAMPEKSRVKAWGEMMIRYITNPQLYDHEPIHGEVLSEYIEIVESGKPKVPVTQKDVDMAFTLAEQRKLDQVIEPPPRHKKPDGNLSGVELEQKKSALPKPDLDHLGSRTIPSKKIKETDRSERTGEDRRSADRVAATTGKGEVSKEKVEKVVLDREIERLVLDISLDLDDQILD